MERDIYIDIEEKYADGIFTIKCDPSKPIKDLKERIKKQYGIPEYCQKLFFNNIELSDYNKFSDYNIKATDGYNYEGRSRLNFINLHNLKTIVHLNDITLKYYLKASDSILNLKKIIFERENIPINKMQILKSDIIIDDSKLIEDFMSDLNFELKLLKIEKIKLNIINDRSIETIMVDPFSTISEIESQLKKDFNYRIKYKDNFLYNGKLLIQYNIKDGDNLELIKIKGKKIRLTISFLDKRKIYVNAYLEQKIYELKHEIYNITGNYDIGLKYCGIVLNNNKTLSDYEIEDDDNIMVYGHSIGGCSKN